MFLYTIHEDNYNGEMPTIKKARDYDSLDFLTSVASFIETLQRQYDLKAFYSVNDTQVVVIINGFTILSYDVKEVVNSTVYDYD